MFAWIIDYILIYVIAFFWGYLTMKLFHGSFWGIAFALIIGISYYDLSNYSTDYFRDVAFIVGAVDYKFELREKAGSYLAYGVQVGLSGVKEDLAEKIQVIRQKMSLDGYIENDNNQSSQSNSFNQEWYDEQLRKTQAEANRAKEQAQRAKEEAQREKQKNQQNNQQQNQQNQSNKKALDPMKLKDAYEILGVEYGADKVECKKHFRRLMAMYHPDKLAGFTGYRRKQMEQEAKDIGLAWDIVQNVL